MIRHYQEVYDMNTTVDSMTILAIHTPQAMQLKKMFKGHFINYKKYKILGCNIRMACASTLPLSPDQVGLEAGDVDPRDVMNPMLFKACTGENLNVLLNQIYNKSEERQDASGFPGSAIGEHKIKDVTSRSVYYQLLSDPTWRKAHPQQGLTIKSLKPFVHKVATTQPFKWTGVKANHSATGFTGADSSPIAGFTSSPTDTTHWKGAGAPSGVENDGTLQLDATNPNVFVSNGVTSMPWLDTAVQYGKGSPLTVTGNWLITDVPRVYMGCLIMPPAVSTKFYMRMVIDWKIAFKDWRPSYEIGSLVDSVLVGSGTGPDGMAPTVGLEGDNYTTYFNYYHDPEDNSSKMEEGEQFKDESSFTSNGLDSSEMVYAS